MTIAILGPFEIVHDGESLNLGGRKQRSLLALLALRLNHPVATGEIVEDLWGEDPPERANETVRVFVSKLRRILEPSKLRIETTGGGYQLTANARDLDANAFERFIRLGRSSMQNGQADDAIAAFDQALALVRGPTGIDLDGERVQRAAVRFQELAVGAAEDRIDALLASGRALAAIPELEALIQTHPYHERLRGQLMRALYACGRQADAIACYQSARQHFVETLGIEPGPELADLERAILSHDLDRETGPAPSPDGHGQATVPLATDGSAMAVLHTPAGRYLVGGEPCVLGRGPDCSVALDNVNVSRRHAVIRRVQDRFVIADLGSTNGTQVNGVTAVMATPLEPGDTIELAGTALAFELWDGH